MLCHSVCLLLRDQTVYFIIVCLHLALKADIYIYMYSHVSYEGCVCILSFTLKSLYSHIVSCSLRWQPLFWSVKNLKILIASLIYIIIAWNLVCQLTIILLIINTILIAMDTILVGKYGLVVLIIKAILVAIATIFMGKYRLPSYQNSVNYKSKIYKSRL